MTTLPWSLFLPESTAWRYFTLIAFISVVITIYYILYIALVKKSAYYGEICKSPQSARLLVTAGVSLFEQFQNYQCIYSNTIRCRYWPCLFILCSNLQLLVEIQPSSQRFPYSHTLPYTFSFPFFLFAFDMLNYTITFGAWNTRANCAMSKVNAGWYQHLQPWRSQF